jgi:hypothetical protein
MSCTNDERLSQAQQVRRAAWHMANQTEAHDHHGNDPGRAKRVLERAAEIEKWLWKAEGEGQLQELISAATEAERLMYGNPNHADLVARLQAAIRPFRR